MSDKSKPISKITTFGAIVPSPPMTMTKGQVVPPPPPKPVMPPPAQPKPLSGQIVPPPPTPTKPK
jgi:hypothetical protein